MSDAYIILHYHTAYYYVYVYTHIYVHSNLKIFKFCAN